MKAWWRGAVISRRLRLGMVRRMLHDIAAAEEGWVCWSFSNHDVERAVSRWNSRPGETPDPRFAEMLAPFPLNLRDSVCLYQGEELGLPEARLAEHELRDPFGIAFWPEFRGRDGSRAPMPWREGAANAGFTVGEPWLPVPAEHCVLAVDAQERDGGSLLHAWRRALTERRAHRPWSAAHSPRSTCRNRWSASSARPRASGFCACSICPAVPCRPPRSKVGTSRPPRNSDRGAV